MKRGLKVGGLVLSSLLIFAPLASAQRGGFRGGWGGGGGWGGWYGAGFYGPGWWGPGWGWDGGWYGPYAYGYAPYAYAPTQSSGKVKIDLKAKDAKDFRVYVDGGYAGTIHELGTFHLKTGEHDIQIRNPQDVPFFKQQVNVLPGATTDIKVPKSAAPEAQG